VESGIPARKKNGDTGHSLRRTQNRSYAAAWGPLTAQTPLGPVNSRNSAGREWDHLYPFMKLLTMEKHGILYMRHAYEQQAGLSA